MLKYRKCAKTKLIKCEKSTKNVLKLRHKGHVSELCWDGWAASSGSGSSKRKGCLG